MKNPGFIIIWLVIMAGGLNYSCRQTGNAENRLPAWSSNDPLAIPYWIRQQKADKGNLVRNGSFELGKWLSVDTLIKSYSVEGWQKKGANVYWVDMTTDTTLSADEIYSGQHAIKIIRTTADEIVEEGDGIMSNFIRVIPGNYAFSFYTRLLDIRPYSARLGTRMHDAVEIKLLFYDKNKILLDSRYLMPFKGQQIDNSFKSLSFANFDHIKEFNWGRIIGKSHGFPFCEGDIPDDARYVKLFIGLKGTGTMWIDDIDFHYTRSNFTPLERFGKIMDSSLTKQDLIIPTPKQIRTLASVIIYQQGQEMESLPRIVIPAHPDEDTRQAASLLQERLIRILKISGAEEQMIKTIAPQVSISPDELNRSKLVFSVGKSSLYMKYKEMLPVKAVTGYDQGYFVYTSNDLPNLVFLAGNKEIGDFYAATTVLQLFDNRYPVFYNAWIIDYPDILERFFYVSAWKDQGEMDNHLNTIRSLLPFKVNGAYIGITPDPSGQYYLNSLTSFGDQWRNSEAFHFIQWIVPASADSFPIRTSVSGMTLCSIAQDKNTEDLIKKLMDAGHRAKALGMAIAPSYIYPCDSTLGYNLSDVLRLTDSFSHEMQLMQRLLQHRHSCCSSDIMEYCLPWYNNELIDYSLHYADAFISNMTDNPDKQISFLWSGSSFYTVKTDAADIFRYNSLLGNKTVLLDNSLLTVSKKAGYGGSVPYYPRKLRLYNIFEPYGNDELAYYSNLINHNRVFVNQSVHSELEKIKILTAIDFYWNMKAYDMDFSLWKILVSRYGIAMAEELMIFGDGLSSLLEINLHMRQKDQVNKNYRAGGDALLVIQKHLNNIANGLGKDNPLVVELTALYQENKNTLESLYRENQP